MFLVIDEGIEFLHTYSRTITWNGRGRRIKLHWISLGYTLTIRGINAIQRFRISDQAFLLQQPHISYRIVDPVQPALRCQDDHDDILLLLFSLEIPDVRLIRVVVGSSNRNLTAWPIGEQQKPNPQQSLGSPDFAANIDSSHLPTDRAHWEKLVWNRGW